MSLNILLSMLNRTDGYSRTLSNRILFSSFKIHPFLSLWTNFTITWFLTFLISVRRENLGEISQLAPLLHHTFKPEAWGKKSLEKKCNTTAAKTWSKWSMEWFHEKQNFFFFFFFLCSVTIPDCGMEKRLKVHHHFLKKINVEAIESAGLTHTALD